MEWGCITCAAVNVKEVDILNGILVTLEVDVLQYGSSKFLLVVGTAPDEWDAELAVWHFYVDSDLLTLCVEREGTLGNVDFEEISL